MKQTYLRVAPDITKRFGTEIVRKGMALVLGYIANLRKGQISIFSPFCGCSHDESEHCGPPTNDILRPHHVSCACSSKVLRTDIFDEGTPPSLVMSAQPCNNKLISHYITLLFILRRFHETSPACMISQTCTAPDLQI